jgi:hypothetical protein
LRKLRQIVVGLVASATMLAVIAAPASAIEWTGTDNHWSGTLKFKHKELGTSECTFSKQKLEASSGSIAFLSNEWPGWVAAAKCTGGGNPEWAPIIEIREPSAGKYEVWSWEDFFWYSHFSPWNSPNGWYGVWEPEEPNMTLINGNGIEHTRIVFNESHVDDLGPWPVFVSGTITADGNQRIK